MGTNYFFYLVKTD